MTDRSAPTPSPSAPSLRLDVVLPVHDEVETIERVLDELHEVLRIYVVPRFVVCEDGSRDGTPQLLERLRARLPIVLCTATERRGYARAVLDGIGAAETDYVLAIDADGQCDPRDLPRFLALAETADVIFGVRVERRDPLARRIGSWAFGLLHRGLFGRTVTDPSCPYVLVRRAAIAPLLGRMGTLPYGLWWELAGRARLAGLVLAEVPTGHRPRLAGSSRAFPVRKMPQLAFTHALGLIRIRLPSRRGSSEGRGGSA